MSATTTLLGLAALVGIVIGIKKLKKKYAERKREGKKPDTVPSKDNKAQELSPPSGEDENEKLSPPQTDDNENEKLSPPQTISEDVEIDDIEETNDNIFISHKNEEVVETLERNLTNIGYRVLFDNEEEQTTNDTNYNQAILVVTPDAIESGWIREEYELMLKRQQNDPDFNFIPVIFSDVATDSPFLSDVEVVNFSTTEYHEAFRRLVSYFGEKFCDENKLELPSKPRAKQITLTDDIHQFIETLFTHFVQNSPPPLMLLAQNNRSQAPLVDALLAHAQDRYQAERCLHLALPYSTEAYVQDYFSVLAQQCGLSENINNGIEFEQALQIQSTNSPKPLFLLVSRFEHGAAFARQQLAGILRSLTESYANQLHIILCGGEKLSELKYPHGSHSLLNTAKVFQWPELGRADVYAVRNNYYQDLFLNDESADNLLLLSGGHPTLLQKCLYLYQRDSTQVWQDYPLALQHEPFSLITKVARNYQEAQQVRQWLAHEEVAPTSALFSYDHKRNELVRHLYWQNLLAERQVNGHKRLCWRSEALKSVVNDSLSKG